MSIPVLIRESFRRCLLAVLVQLGAACAQGYATDPPQAIEVPVLDAGHAVFTGDSCTIGDRQSCACAMGGTGLRACVPDKTSPTGGALSGCLPCDTTQTYAAGHAAGGTPATAQTSSAVTEPPAAGKPAVSRGGSGGGGASASASNMAGKGGTGGSSNTSSGSGGKASASAGGGTGGKPAAGGGGSGGRSSGGTTSSGATSSGSKACSSDCAAQLCFPLGVLGCCKSNGTCGCTWAPGAYCM